MFQEWETPSFDFEQLIEYCTDFFKSRELPATVQRKGQNIAVVSADAFSLVVEQVGTMLKVTFPPPSRAGRDLNRFLGIFVTGLGVKADAERQLSLDRLELDFWEYLDQRLADLEAQKPTNSD
jgi:nucleoid-associated protein YejK